MIIKLLLLQLGGEVDDCSCTVESVDSFNNKEIFPDLKSLLEKDYFKFYPVSKTLVDITSNQLFFLGRRLEEFIASFLKAIQISTQLIIIMKKLLLGQCQLLCMGHSTT